MKAHDLVRSILQEDKQDFRLPILERAQKFDISALSPDGNGDEHLLEFASDLIYAGLFRLPFPDVYLEATFQPSAAVARRTVGIVGSQAQNGDGLSILVAPYSLCDDCGDWHELGGYAVLTIPSDPLSPPACILDDRVVTGHKSTCFDDADGSARFWRIMRGALAIFIAGVVGIASKSTILKIEPAPERLNRRRLKQGKVPLFEHRVVTLGRRVSPSSSGVGMPDRASPRLHWRRGHLRDLPCGRRVPIPPAIVGLADDGTISHDYRIRRVPPP